MVTAEYKIAYSEVLEILKYISKEEYNKIPKEMIQMFKTNATNESHFAYNSNKTLQEQNVSETARTIIAILFRDYWATEVQKEKILASQSYEREKLKEKMYNPDDILKKKKEQLFEKNITNEVAMVEYKENIFKKILNRVKKFFLK